MTRDGNDWRSRSRQTSVISRCSPELWRVQLLLFNGRFVVLKQILT